MLWLEGRRQFPTRLLQSHMRRAVERRQHLSLLAIIESVALEAVGVAADGDLQVLAPEKIAAYFVEKNPDLIREQTRRSLSRNTLLPPLPPDQAIHGTDERDLIPGQDYNLAEIQEWFEGRPGWMSRYKDLREIGLISVSDWLRAHLRHIDGIDAHWSRHDPLFDFAYRRGTELKRQKAELLRELRTLARLASSVEAVSGHFDSLVLLPRGNRVVVRPMSTLTQGRLDFRDSTPVEGVVGDLGEQSSSLRAQPWEELEDLMNNESAAERDFQAFFEAHPDLLLGTDYERFVSQPVLTRQDEANLVPDFILFPYDGSKAPKILDLKLPRPKIFVSKQNRTRYSSAIHEVRAQLLQYQRYFGEASRAIEAKKRFGTEIFMPEIAVIVGRNDSHTSRLDVLRARQDLPDLDVRTYDDVVAAARRLHALGLRQDI
ncbi:Shedu anti-phage system protein SduA domain-containing protein [Asanoa ferruginea]|nr:Shedu anti-phage system protein SduA domain-containing protein [Asanoa ferruginea]